MNTTVTWLNAVTEPGAGDWLVIEGGAVPELTVTVTGGEEAKPPASSHATATSEKSPSASGCQLAWKGSARTVSMTWPLARNSTRSMRPSRSKASAASASGAPLATSKPGAGSSSVTKGPLFSGRSSSAINPSSKLMSLLSGLLWWTSTAISLAPVFSNPASSGHVSIL